MTEAGILKKFIWGKENMRIKPSWISISILAFFITVIAVGSTLAAETKKTIEGIVTESYQIITDNDEVYDIGDSETGDKIIENAGAKVRATGKVEYDEETDTRTITVESFKVIEEAVSEAEPEDEPEEDMEMDLEMDAEE